MSKYGLDQFGDPVPDDLVLLPEPDPLDEESIAGIDKADWYEEWYQDKPGLLFVSWAQVSNLGLDYDNPEDSGSGSPAAEYFLVAPGLHRYSEEDGWYHA